MLWKTIAHMANHIYWPPTYPRKATLLGDDPGDIKTPRDQWGADEWKAYALFLEAQGAYMARDLKQTRELLGSTLSKLRRSDKPTHTLLWSPEKQKRGRKNSSTSNSIALKALAIQNELVERDGKCTAKEALKEYFRRHPPRRTDQELRHLMNIMSKLR